MPRHDVFFEGLEEIPHLTNVRDANGDILYHQVAGEAPIVVVACHSGTPESTPSGARLFGTRTARGRSEPSLGDDTNTFKITLALVRALAALGARPHAFLNLISRQFVDHNRTWDGQLGWDGVFGMVRPGDETLPAAQAPHGARLAEFKRNYYDPFQDAVDSACRQVHPDGWLFDVHGMGRLPGTLVMFSGYGNYARQDVVHSGANCLHATLAAQSFPMVPAVRGAAGEIRDLKTGLPIKNFMSGSLHGARLFEPTTDPVPFPGNVAPTAPQRVHGVQFEIDHAFRGNRSDEDLEEIGLRLGTAIHQAMLAKGVLTRTATNAEGRGAQVWYQMLA
jgi:hypothetical protein